MCFSISWPISTLDWDVDDKLISIAEKVYEMVVVLGGENADFNHQDLIFDTMEPL